MNSNIQDSIKETEEKPTTPPSIPHDLHDVINLVELIKSTFESKICQPLKQLGKLAHFTDHGHDQVIATRRLSRSDEATVAQVYEPAGLVARPSTSPQWGRP